MSEPAGRQDRAVPRRNYFQDRYIILVIVLSAVFMGVLDTNVVYLALHKITTDFGTDLAQTQWVITAYLISNTSLLLIFGRLSEHTGKARLFLAGIALFTVSSLACGLAAGIWRADLLPHHTGHRRFAGLLHQHGYSRDKLPPGRAGPGAGAPGHRRGHRQHYWPGAGRFHHRRGRLAVRLPDQRAHRCRAGGVRAAVPEARGDDEQRNCIWTGGAAGYLSRP